MEKAAAVPKSSKFGMGVAAGQCVAFIDSFGGMMTELAGDHSLPMFMALGCYLLLISTHGVLHLKSHGCRLTLPLWKYLLVASIDVSAAYFTLLSLRYTSVTSWALIQPFSLVVAAPLSIYVLKASYNWRHLTSGLLAVAGLVLLILSDIHSDDSGDHHSTRSKLTGDLFAFLGVSLYGFNDVMLELVVKGEVPQRELLSAIGVFGSCFSCVLALLLGEISADMFPSGRIALYTFGTIAVNFSFYTIAIFVLEHAGAAVLIISLLTVNFWSVLWKLLIIGGFHTHLIGFIFALVMVVTGVAWFALSGDPYAKDALSYAPLETELPSRQEPPPSQLCKETTP